MAEKEKDVAFLQENLHELKKRVNEKENEVAALKFSNVNIEKEMNLLKKQNQKSKKVVERELEILILKNKLLENKVDLLGNQLGEAKNLLNEKQVEILLIKSEVEEIKNASLSQQLISPINEEVKMLKDKIIKSQDEIKITKRHLDNCLNRKATEMRTITARVSTNENLITNNFNNENLLQDNITILKEDVNKEIKLIKNWQKEVDTTKTKMNDIISHMENIENIIFCDQNNKNIKLKWILHNYEYHFDVGEKVYSPVFHTQINGYCFQLHIAWSGENKETLGVYLHLHHGRNYDKPLEQFRMQYTFEIPDKEGNSCCHTIDANDKLYLTIHPNENVVSKGFGPSNILMMPFLQNFIINDMLTIYCTLKHSA